MEAGSFEHARMHCHAHGKLVTLVHVYDLYIIICTCACINFYRLVILRKKPTILKLLCALMVFVALILSLIPVITGMDKESKEGKQAWLQQSTASRILWPLCFMFGFVSVELAAA